MIFGVFCCVMTIHVFLMYPETAGRSLEEIDMVFDAGAKPWKSAQMHDRFEEEIEKVRRGSVGKEDGASHEEVV